MRNLPITQNTSIQILDEQNFTVRIANTNKNLDEVRKMTNLNQLIVGAARRGKTTSIVSQILTGEGNYIIFERGEEIRFRVAEKLKIKGYKVICLDFEDYDSLITYDEDEPWLFTGLTEKVYNKLCETLEPESIRKEKFAIFIGVRGTELDDYLTDYTDVDIGKVSCFSSSVLAFIYQEYLDGEKFYNFTNIVVDNDILLTSLHRYIAVAKLRNSRFVISMQRYEDLGHIYCAGNDEIIINNCAIHPYLGGHSLYPDSYSTEILNRIFNEKIPLSDFRKIPECYGMLSILTSNRERFYFSRERFHFSEF